MVVVASTVVVGAIIDVGVGVVVIAWSMVVGGSLSSWRRQWWGVGQWWWGGGVDVVTLSVLVVGAHRPHHPHHPC